MSKRKKKRRHKEKKDRETKEKKGGEEEYQSRKYENQTVRKNRGEKRKKKLTSKHLQWRVWSVCFQRKMNSKKQGQLQCPLVCKLCTKQRYTYNATL